MPELSTRRTTGAFSEQSSDYSWILASKISVTCAGCTDSPTRGSPASLSRSGRYSLPRKLPGRAGSCQPERETATTFKYSLPHAKNSTPVLPSATKTSLRRSCSSKARALRCATNCGSTTRRNIKDHSSSSRVIFYLLMRIKVNSQVGSLPTSGDRCAPVSTSRDSHTSSRATRPFLMTVPNWLTHCISSFRSRVFAVTWKISMIVRSSMKRTIPSLKSRSRSTKPSRNRQNVISISFWIGWARNLPRSNPSSHVGAKGTSPTSDKSKVETRKSYSYVEVKLTVTYFFISIK